MFPLISYSYWIIHLNTSTNSTFRNTDNNSSMNNNNNNKWLQVWQTVKPFLCMLRHICHQRVDPPNPAWGVAATSRPGVSPGDLYSRGTTKGWPEGALVICQNLLSLSVAPPWHGCPVLVKILIKMRQENTRQWAQTLSCYVFLFKIY